MPLHVSRRAFAGGSFAAMFATNAFALSKDLSTLPRAPFVEARTTAGRVRGGTARGALCFKGIPYAGPVSGAGRFKAPPPVTPWTGVRDALSLGAPTVQRPNNTYGEQEPAPGEDCLFLNLWTPAIDNKARPVMVYLHGGGYEKGSSGSPTQDGGRLAERYDVVVVAPNHRLGLLGFLRLPGQDYATSGNQGMYDVIAALKWVRDNIHEFGGDPGNVTIFGESGGGAKVGSLMGMPDAKGLFHKAGIASGAQINRMPLGVAEETTRRLMKALDITDPLRLIEAPAEALLALQLAGEDGEGPMTQPTEGFVAPGLTGIPGMSFTESLAAGRFSPVVDGVCMPSDPFDPITNLCADVPLFIGNTRTESSFFFLGQPEVYDMRLSDLVQRLGRRFPGNAEDILNTYHGLYPKAKPSDLFLLITTAASMGHETVVAADRKSAQPAPVYRYRWDYASNRPIEGTNATLGAGHATDIGPMCDNWDASGLHGNGPGVKAASENLSALWTSFARSGVPTAPGVPPLPAYDTASRPVMLVDAQCRVENDPDAVVREMWTRLYGA